MFNESQITVEEKSISKLSEIYEAVRTLQLYGLGCSFPGMEDCIFQLKEILNDQSMKCRRQSKIADFFLQQSAFDLCLSVNVYCSVILHQKIVYFNAIKLFGDHN